MSDYIEHLAATTMIWLYMCVATVKFLIKALLKYSQKLLVGRKKKHFIRALGARWTLMFYYRLVLLAYTGCFHIQWRRKMFSSWGAEEWWRRAQSTCQKFLKWLPVLSPICAATCSSFRLLRLLQYEQAREVSGHALPGKKFKIRHSGITSEAMFGPN